MSLSYLDQHSAAEAQPAEPSVAPLSATQQRMWFSEQLVPGTALQNIPLAVRLRGPVDDRLVVAALQSVIERHPMLRTSFAEVAGQPVQKEWDLVALQPETATPRTDIELTDWLDELSTRPFDLAEPPLLRAGLARTAPDELVLAVVVHHLICDGWSLDLLIRDFTEQYRRLATDAPADPAPAASYREIIHASQAKLDRGELDGQLGYWLDTLAGELPTLELPVDRPRPEEPGYRGARTRITVPDALVARLVETGRACGATPYMVLISAYAALLSRLTGQSEVIVGSPVAGRTALESEDVIGLFANTVALRLDLSGSPSLRELIRRVRRVAGKAFANQELPFDRLVQAIRPDRSSHLSPLFQTMFVLQNATVSTLDLPGITAEPIDLHNRTSRFDLQLLVGQRAEGWAVTAEYDTDLFEPATVHRILQRYLTVLTAIADDPEIALSRLPILAPDERGQLLELGGPQQRFPVTQTLHERFREQARLRPAAIAVSCGDEHLSYAELDRRSDELAERLRHEGVGPDVLVGLMLRRGLDIPTAILGILKTGGGYVPIDSVYPPGRIAAILDSCQPALLVTHAEFENLLPAQPKRLLLDRPWSPDPDYVPCAHPAAQPDDCCYVIYTSGSTGTPKGVQVTHDVVIRMFAAMQASPSFDFDADDVVPMLHSYAFDVSVVEMWGALLHGGRLVIVPLEVARDPEAYYALVRDEGVTVLNQTPSAFVHFAAVDAGQDPTALRLRTIIFGGEALEPGMLAGWIDRHGDRTPRLVNMYGITETIHITIREMTAEDVRLNRRSPIGRPMADMELYLLDELMQPVPVGSVGEFYAGGPGLARCYFGDPTKTADRFVPHPFSSVPGDRLYRSGDLGRVNADGEFEYIGRADHQVKIRGYRIEIGEIESAFLATPEVHAVVVQARPAPDGDKRLHAWITLETPGDRESALAAIREQIAVRLPAYMLPSTITVLERLPLTVNGKVDRKALPTPDAQPIRSASVAPRTETEAEVATIWAELLDLPHLGVTDNFFDLGGHSLLATKLVFRLRERFDTELPLRALFADPTVAGIAARLDGVEPPSTEPVSAVPIEDLQLGEGISGYTPTGPRWRQVLLTGATGFLGAFVLRSLLDRTEAEVHCLVRAADGAAAQRRLVHTLIQFGLMDAKVLNRVRAVPGDLSRDRFGLADAEYHRLTGLITEVVHVGAAVNLVLPYAELRSANVDGTRTVLRFGTDTGRAPIHHVSTAGVFARGLGRPIAEQDVTGPVAELRQGYTQSKWAAEQLIGSARELGVPVTLHRPGRISGHSSSGACQTDDLLWRILGGCIHSGLAPAGLTADADLVPVDYVADGIVEIAKQPAAIGGIFHHVNTRPVPVQRLLDDARAFGYRIDEVGLTDWVRAVAADPDNPAFPLLSLFDGGAGFVDVAFDDTATRLRLAGTDLWCPELSPDLVARYLDWFVRTGFLPAVSTASS